MIRLLTTSLVTLVLFLAGCSNGSKTESNEPSTSSTQTPAQTTGSPKGEALVTALPAGIEGVELAEGGLRLLDGYEFVKDSDSTFYVARINTGRPSTPKPGGGCKCSSGSGSCSPVLRGEPRGRAGPRPVPHRVGGTEPDQRGRPRAAGRHRGRRPAMGGRDDP